MKELAPYKNEVEEAISESILTFGPKTRLRDAVEYALKNAGKRFRPSIVYMIARTIGKNLNVKNSALAIEFFHTASLIADDLPCMDNDAFRREVPSLHAAFDEATAILATYALIGAGYEKIRLNAAEIKRPDLGMIAIEVASYNTGIFGATSGQYFDLFPKEQRKKSTREIIEKKTATLFEISFVFGWLFGGGDLFFLDLVKRAAFHFGMAFQISDDILDVKQDEGKINYAREMGIAKATHDLLFELTELKKLLEKLRLDSPELLALIHMIESRSQTEAGSFS